MAKKENKKPIPAAAKPIAKIVVKRTAKNSVMPEIKSFKPENVEKKEEEIKVENNEQPIVENLNTEVSVVESTEQQKHDAAREEWLKNN